jgi:nicotinamidase-related amidase
MIPRTTALLLLDLQQAVLPTIATVDRLLADTARALSWARSSGVAVHHVRLSLESADRAAIPARNKMFGRFVETSFCATRSPGTAFPPTIAPAAGERIYDKRRVGAFRTTSLHYDLAASGIDTLILGGIHTSGVVLSTLRDAADLDYGLIVPAELCADPDPDVHQLLLGQLFPRQADVVSLDRLLAGAAAGGRHGR